MDAMEPEIAKRDSVRPDCPDCQRLTVPCGRHTSWHGLGGRFHCDDPDGCDWFHARLRKWGREPRGDRG